MAEKDSEGPVAEFCAGLRRLQQGCGLDRAALARRLRYSRSQLYQILDGRISRPPEWDRVVEPLVRACTGNDERAVALWRRRHAVLIEVYSALRRHDRRTDVPTPPARVIPAQLPADVDVFTGRTQELAELDRILAVTTDRRAAGERATSVVISAVSGTAGVGKTALALRWAHRVRSAFPDGQLYVNLRGYDPDQPVSAADALAAFLRALGLAGADIPLEVEERAASYRSLLDGRQVLVVLDNAASVEQVRPLLPGVSSCLVVMTSRDSLAGLVARHGARRLDLDLLPPEDAVALLRALVGGQVEAEPDAAVMLAGQCARLPLALRVAAELAAARPGTSLAALVEELADEQRRLELLDAGGDPRTAVRAVFSWSYRHLSVEAARAFRLLGLHPGPDLDPYAVAALTDRDLDRARHVFGLLTRAHLVQSIGPGRYGMHDLLRAYAASLADTEDSEPEREAALTRLFDSYLATAAVAMDTLVPAEQHRRPRVPPTATPCPPLPDPAAAQAWLDAELGNLTTTCVHTATRGWPGHSIKLAITLFRYLDMGGHYPEALTVHTSALHAARHAGDPAAEAHALTNLGTVHWQQGRYDVSADHLRQALTRFRELGDRSGEGRALANLGLVSLRQGRYDQSTDHLRQALALFREIGDRRGEGGALDSLGGVYWQQGRYDESVDRRQQALALLREIGDRSSEACALTNLGFVYLRQGRYDRSADHLRQALALFRELGQRGGEAHALANLGNLYSRQGRDDQSTEHLQQGLTLFREIGDRSGEADALANLGLVSLRQGRYDQSTDHLQQALALFREIGERGGETEALNGLGETLRATGQPPQARLQHTAALTLATRIGDRYEQARAHDGLAHTHHAASDIDLARHHWGEALTLYTDLGVPDAEVVHAHLAALDPPGRGDHHEE